MATLNNYCAGNVHQSKSLPKLLRFAPDNSQTRALGLTKGEHYLGQSSPTVASLRRLFVFTGTPFGFPLEAPSTFIGIPHQSNVGTN